MKVNEKPFYTVEKIVLTPKGEHAGWSIERSYDTLYCDSAYDTRFAGGDLIFSATEWEWEVTYTRSAKFQKIADLVGEEAAEQVLRALGERE